MATGTGVSTGKSAFVEKFLTENQDANRTAINEAWKAAGNDDQISESLVYKLRAKHGRTDKKPTSKAQAPSKSGSSTTGKSKSSSKGTASKSKSTVQSTSQPVVAENGTGPVVSKPAASPAKKAVTSKVTKVRITPTATMAAAKHTAHQSRLVDEVEAGIDELIFNLKSSGGVPEVEAALRTARRLLTRGHGE
jgi:hypothetical protein